MWRNILILPHDVYDTHALSREMLFVPLFCQSCQCQFQCQGYIKHWESENICTRSMPVVYIFKKFPEAAHISHGFPYGGAVKLLLQTILLCKWSVTLCMCIFLLLRCRVCSSLSATLLSRWMEAVKKGKVYENERQIIHTSAYKHTHTYPSAPPLLSLSVRRPFV